MTKHLPALLIALLIAAVWGYFADLRHGEVGWFIGRLVIVPLVTVALLNVWAPRRAIALDAGEQR